MKNKVTFEDSTIIRFLFKLLAPILESPFRHKLRNPFMTLKAAGIRPGQEVLEIGCGTGFYTMDAAKMVKEGGHIWAIDMHPLAIEQVSKKIQEVGLNNVKLIKANAIETGLASRSIDLILLFGVIPSPTLPIDQLLPEMHRLLKPGGTLSVKTAVPWWSPNSLTKDGLFSLIEKKSGVYNFRKVK